MLEAGTRRPCVERTHRTGLPDRDLMTLAELGGAVTVELEDLGQRGGGVWAHRAVAGCRGRDLGDTTHPDAVMVPPVQQRGPRRRAQGRRVESVVLESLACEALSRRGADRAAKRAAGGKSDVVDQDEEDVRCAIRRSDFRDRRKACRRVLGVVGREPGRRAVRYGKHRALDLIRHVVPPSFLLRVCWLPIRVRRAWRRPRSRGSSRGPRPCRPAPRPPAPSCR